MRVLLVDQIATVNYKYSFSLAEHLKNKVDLTMVIDEKKICDSDIDSYSYFNTTDKDKNKIEKGIQYIKAWQHIVKLCKKKNIDILHVQWFILSPIDLYYVKKIKKMGVKLVVTVHDILPFNEKFYDYKSHKQIYKLADKIIVQAKPNIDKINDLFKGIKHKVSYIPHGNFVDYVDIISKEQAREYLGIPEEKKVILFFGQIKKVKGLDILIKAFINLVNNTNDKNLMLLVAGKVWEDNFDQYQEIIDESEVKEQIRLDIKYIPDNEICDYYCAADINVLPYKEVYQSGVVHLAYAYNKAVIATNVGSFPEVVVDGKSGLLVEKDNINELENAMKKIIYDNKVLEHMGSYGRAYIEKNFSWETIANSILSLYENIEEKKNND